MDYPYFHYTSKMYIYQFLLPYYCILLYTKFLNLVLKSKG